VSISALVVVLELVAAVVQVVVVVGPVLMVVVMDLEPQPIHRLNHGSYTEPYLRYLQPPRAH